MTGAITVLRDYWDRRARECSTDTERVDSTERSQRARFAFAARFNRYMNDRHGDGRAWNDHDMRADVMRTFAWGGVGEPAFVRNLDVDAARTTGPERPRFQCA